MKTITARFVFVLVLLFTVPAMSAEPKPANRAVDVEAAAVNPKTTPKAPVPGGRNDSSKLWWNEPDIREALSLTDRQIEKMTGLLATHRAKIPPTWRLESFHESLLQRDWKAATGESKKISKSAELALRMRGQLKIDILSQLTQEQHELLVDRFPKVIYKPWARATRATRATQGR